MQLPRDVPWYARIVRLFRWFHRNQLVEAMETVAQTRNLTGSVKSYGARYAAADIETSGAHRATVDVLSIERRTGRRRGPCDFAKLGMLKCPGMTFNEWRRHVFLAQQNLGFSISGKVGRWS
jgi:hypothetical protein